MTALEAALGWWWLPAALSLGALAWAALAGDYAERADLGEDVERTAGNLRRAGLAMAACCLAWGAYFALCAWTVYD